MNRKLFIILSLVLMLCLGLSNHVGAQNQNPLEPIIATADGGYCEGTKAILDRFCIEARNDGIIILVARLGNGEVSRKFNRERLQHINYYLNVTRGIPKNRLVLADGERVRGLGRVEIYAEGKLMLVLTVKRNGDILGLKSCGLE
jgi:hypothetical protein